MTTADANTNTTPGQAQEYPWQLAPAHLKTRRQLRAAGLQPNRQPVAALMVGKRRGRRLVAHLYDLAKAAPKKPPTAAQLAAAAAAAREHQARAAERHGIDRAELDRTQDPAPGWDHTPESTTHKEENTMSDTTSQGRDPDALQLGTPTGHGQRIAHLFAVVAVNQARTYLDKLDEAVEEAERKGADAVGRLEVRMLADVEAAEARLTANTADQGPASVEPLADALAFSSGSDLAADRLDRLIGAYRIDWGVRIDAMSLTVDIDPDFDAVTHQDTAEAQALYDRESYAVDIVTAMPMQEAAKTAATEAVTAWQDRFHQPGLREYLDTQTERRQKLGEALAGAKLSASDRAAVEFAVDFLRSDVRDVDLLASPVWVDPGEETRSRVPELLDRFARNPKFAKEVGREISVMTAADQKRVQDAGKAIAAGKPVDPKLWPGYVQRQALAEDLESYADDVQDLRSCADFLAEDGYSDEERGYLGHKTAGSQDEVSACIDRIVEAREKLMDQVQNGKGLASIERAHLAAVLTDIDNGHTGPDQLPELLFADEVTRAEVDSMRTSEIASRLATATQEAITQRIEATSAVEPGSRAQDRLTQDVASIGFALHNVASGSQAFSLEQKRAAFVERRGQLEQTLTQAGVQVAARAEIRGLVDARGKEAGQLGQTATRRREQWHTRTAQAVTARDTAAARRAAVDAGDPSPAERACATRPTRAAGQQAASTGRGARIAQLHTQEVGR